MAALFSCQLLFIWPDSSTCAKIRSCAAQVPLTAKLGHYIKKNCLKMLYEGILQPFSSPPLLWAEMIMFSDCVLASAQLLPKRKAFSVCLICRFAWSVSHSDSVISRLVSIWELLVTWDRHTTLALIVCNMPNVRGRTRPLDTHRLLITTPAAFWSTGWATKSSLYKVTLLSKCWSTSNLQMHEYWNVASATIRRS